jgi:creatinine amidohydrolase
MTGHSIFHDTLADMTWPAVEEAASRNTPLLVPVAVIEQHGPHLPLATDTYGAYLLCTLIKAELAKSGIASVIAPPYYFGLNSTTGMFPGSLTVKAETMVTVLTEVLENCALWGFRRQLIVNHHGDPQHNRAVIETIQALRARGIEATLVLGGQVLDFVDAGYQAAFHEPVPLSGDAIIRAPDSEATRAARERLTRSRLDVHAGERETSLIMRYFPETLARGVDILGIEPVPETLREFYQAESSSGWRELSPQGHIGDPAAASIENGELYALEAADMAAAIAAFLRRQ